MFSRQLVPFAGAFLLLALIYIISFNVSVRVDPDAMASRYAALDDGGRYRASSTYGQRLLNHKTKNEASADELTRLKSRLATTYINAKRPERAAPLLVEVLNSDWAEDLTALEKAEHENALAQAQMATGNYVGAVALYAQFLQIAGDMALPAPSASPFHARSGAQKPSLGYYSKAVEDAAALFADAIKPLGDIEILTGERDAQLTAMSHMSELGAHYALRQEALYASAGLLATAYKGRKELLGEDHEDTVQSAMILGPVYERLGRLQDAETLYLEAFHAQEKRIGANSPELSLYLKLLAGVYEAQGRATEAEALYKLMRDLFKDAFGERRYAANRATNRSFDVDRPVSKQFLLNDSYIPGDLVEADKFFVPLSKTPGIDEMTIRLAADVRPDADAREENLPARLAQLLSLCRSETGERLSLRSGYRSFVTQRALYSRIGHNGKVTPPGMSEHQLGLAADIDVNGRLMRQSDKSYRCFEENAFRFGFLLSYPPGNDYLPGADSFEPWHWRYVGVETARLYREAGPVGRPQEFLAALSCYEKQVSAGAFPIAGQRDICLNGVQSEMAIAKASAAGVADDSETTDASKDSSKIEATLTAWPTKQPNGGR